MEKPSLQGMHIGSNDLLIAATTQAHEGVLVTNNVREFEKIGGLALETWTKIDW